MRYVRSTCPARAPWSSRRCCAKATPEAARNEEAYQWAYYFVEETKPVEEQPSAEAEEPLDLTPKNDSHA